jgi:LysM repeat protein
MSHDDDKTQFWNIDDDPEATGALPSARDQGVPRDEELTQVRRPAAPVAPVAPAAPTVVQSGDSARDWLEPAPETFAASPARAARVGRRRRPLWPRLLAPFAFLAAVFAIFSLTVDSGILDKADGGKTGPKKPAASSSAKPKVKIYVVKSGDTVSQIAARFGTTSEELMRLNPTMSAMTVNPGQKIKLPQD